MKHARILIIEDDTDTSDMLKIFFSSQGASVEVASTGEQALNSVHAKLPDLILLDILLPDTDGYAVCQKLRSTPRTQHIPILFLTQKNTRGDILSGLEIGADDYLTKPFDLEELKLRVRNSLQRSRTYRQIDARTSLPTGDLIRKTLSRVILQSNWALFLIRINDFERLRKSEGLINDDRLLGSTAAWLENILRELDDANPFVGYLSAGDFIVITQAELAERVHAACTRFFHVIDDEIISPEISSENPVPDDVKLRLEDARNGMRVDLEIGLLNADEGPFEGVSELLEALFQSLHDRNDATT
jgi:PleD family two-component response regulator